MSRSDVIDLEVEVIHRTGKAVLVTSDGDHQAWLPLSSIELDETAKAAVVTLPERLAIEKELV